MIATMAGQLHRSRLPLMCRLLISSCLPWPWLAEIRQLGRWIEKEPVPVQTPPSVDCHVPCCRSSIPREYGRQYQHPVPLASRRLQQQGADAFEGTAQPRCPGRVLRTDGPRIGRAGPAKEGWAGGEAKALCLSEKFSASRPSDGISGVTSTLSSALCSSGHIPVKPSHASDPG